MLPNCWKIVHVSVVAECPGHSSWYVKLSEIIRNLHIVSSILMVRSKQCIYKIIVTGHTHHGLPGIIRFLQLTTIIPIKELCQLVQIPISWSMQHCVILNPNRTYLTYCPKYRNNQFCLITINTNNVNSMTIIWK